MFWEVKITLY